MNKTVSIIQLKEDLEQLKLLLSKPDLYIWNYFNDLKNEIDIAFGTKLLEEPVDSENLNITWLQMIDKVKQYEQECLTATPSLDQFETKFLKSIYLKSIESKLCEIITEDIESNEPRTKKLKVYVNVYKENEEKKQRLNDLNELIYEETTKLEEVIFLNKSIMFINKEKWLNLDAENKSKRWYSYTDVNIFEKMTASAVGKLICVSNQYFGKRCVKIIKNEIDDYSLRFSIKLSNEILKIKMLKDILKFEMTSNSIDEIWLNFGSLKSVESYTSGLKTISKYLLKDLNNITFIKLNNNNIESIESESFENLTSLTSLNLASNRISDLNENLLSKTVNLHNIDLSFNKIITFPRDFFKNMSNLVNLVLDKNELKSIDKNAFTGLTKLATISITNNYLESINKDTLKEQKNLRRFNASRNCLLTIDADLFHNCTNLFLINLSANKLTSIPATLFSKLIHLKNIDLSKNLITDLDENIFNGLTELNSIIIKENKLTTITNNLFSGLTKLSRINLSKNLINRIDKDVFKDLIRLNHCDLGSNQIEKMHQKCFAKCKKLKRVVLTGNKLTHTNLFLGLDDTVLLY